MFLSLLFKSAITVGHSLSLDSILPSVDDPTHERFDDSVPEKLLLKAYAIECLDLYGAKA